MIIHKDTREKTGWSFLEPDMIVIDTKLDAGDYTLEGYESEIVIERKATTGELAINIGKEWERFKREFERMKDIKRKLIICEFSITDIQVFPINSGIPSPQRYYIRVNSGFMFKRIEEIKNKYGIEFIFAGNSILAEQAAIDIFREVENGPY